MAMDSYILKTEATTKDIFSETKFMDRAAIVGREVEIMKAPGSTTECVEWAF